MVLLDNNSAIATDGAQKVNVSAGGAAVPATAAYAAAPSAVAAPGAAPAPAWTPPGQVNQQQQFNRDKMGFGTGGAAVGGREDERDASGRPTVAVPPPMVPPQPAAAASAANPLGLPENTALSNPNIASANLAVAPTPRPNPHAFCVMNPGYYTVLSNDLTAKVDMARSRQQPSVDIGNGRQIDILFKQCPTIPDAGVNQKGDCFEYMPRWFFLDNRQRWSPMSPHMNFTLCKGKFEGSKEERDAERTYDLVTFNQVNRQSGRRRPLLYVREDGTAVRGDAVASWAYEGQFRGAAASINVPFEVAERLDHVYLQGQPGCEFQFKMQGAAGPAKCKIAFTAGAATHEADVDDGSGYPMKYKFIRYFPTWFFLDGDRHWCSLDYNTTTSLDVACSTGLFTAADHEREYDLVRLEQRNRQSGKVRPLLHVLGHNGTAPGSTPAQHKIHPDIFRRAAMVTDGNLSVDQLRGKINDANVPVIDRLLFFCNGLVHHHRFVIKGGILRDAVVKNDISKSHDIDIELPQVFQQHQLDSWISNFLSQIEQQFGVTRDPSKEVVKRNSWDVLGPATGRAAVSEGIVTVPVKLPVGGPAIDLEMCTPWNTAYNPPSNVDVSINNLRVTCDSKELNQNVPLFYGAGNTERFSVEDIIVQILGDETSPCYDFKWVDGDAASGKTGEGRAKNRWCTGHNDLNPIRTKLMDGRFDKMRSKGYRMVEGPK